MSDEWNRVSEILPPQDRMLETYNKTETNGARATNQCFFHYNPEHMTEPEWCERGPPFGGGRTTVTHSTFLAPTHWRLGRHRDLGIELLKEANAAFGNFTATEPGVPELTQFDADRLRSYAVELAAIAARLKHEAAEANGTGRMTLGLLLIRIQLSVEETGEFAEALAEGDLEHAAKELVDMSYVTDGHYLTLGLGDKKLPLYREVHRSNMSKLDPETGRPIISDAGRWVKGPGYRQTDLGPILGVK